ncbi:MAG TPA: hybrid sensor histidine kinase/response regulator [Ktedonobacterales bacterium]
MSSLLIVDDDLALLQALPEALHLRMEGLQIATAESALTALEMVAQTDYDAIITDIKMPGMDGLTLLRKIKEMRPDTPTLLITGHGDHDLAIQALRGGAYDFIQKPIERDYLIASLQRALQTRRLSRQVQEQHLALEQHATLLEQTVQERTRELLAANQAKDDFISIASHELRTPLTSMKAFIQLTRRKIEQGGSLTMQSLLRMERSLLRMEQLINDMLDVSRIDAGKLAIRLERCDLRELCQQVIEDQRASTARTITLTLPGEPVELELDGERISQVITNLLSNAIKYSPDTSPVSLTLCHAEESVLLSVRDEGSGIPPEALPHLFERFYQAPTIEAQSSSSVGLGLGLYICREIVEQHGGQIWAESTLDQGSAFFVALPTAFSPALARTCGADLSQVEP